MRIFEFPPLFDSPFRVVVQFIATMPNNCLDFFKSPITPPVGGLAPPKGGAVGGVRPPHVVETVEGSLGTNFRHFGGT